MLRLTISGNDLYQFIIRLVMYYDMIFLDADMCSSIYKSCIRENCTVSILKIIELVFGCFGMRKAATG